MKPRFEPNPDAASTREAQRLIDPEAFRGKRTAIRSQLGVDGVTIGSEVRGGSRSG